MLRHHDVRFKDQPGYDVEDRISAACQQRGSVESVFHVLLQCPEYAARKAALRAHVVALPAARGMPLALSDEDSVVALLRDNFLGGSPEAARAVDAFLRDVISFRALCIENLGGQACVAFGIHVSQLSVYFLWWPLHYRNGSPALDDMGMTCHPKPLVPLMGTLGGGRCTTSICMIHSQSTHRFRFQSAGDLKRRG